MKIKNLLLGLMLSSSLIISPVSVLATEGTESSSTEVTSPVTAGTIIDITDSTYLGSTKVAVPNDTTSDSSAIAKALKVANGTGATVYFPAGTWIISKAMVVGSNLNIVADPNAIIIRKDGYTSNIMHSDNSITPSGYGNSSNITISGGIWDGGENSDNTTSANLFYFWHGQNITIKDLTIKHVVGNHFIELAGCNNVNISNCTFSDFIQADGVNYVNGDNSGGDGSSSWSEAIQLDYCSSSTSGSSKPYDNTPSANIAISGCNFTNCNVGVGSHHVGTKSVDNLSVTNCTFTNMTNACFYLWNFHDFTVSGNTATNVRSFANEYYTSNGTISGNNINTNTGVSAVAVIVVNKANATTVDSNTISNCGVPAIKVSGAATDAVISNNTINNCQGILISNGVNKIVTLTGNTIKNTTNNALEITTSNATVTNNTIKASAAIGIKINSKSNVTVDKCTVKTCSGNGVKIDNSSTVTLTNSTIKSNKSNGVKIANSSTVTLKKNTITSNKNNGVKIVSKATATLKKNTVKSNKGNGISISGKATVTLKSNTVKSNKVKDIVINKNSKVTLKSNSVSKKIKYVK